MAVRPVYEVKEGFPFFNVTNVEFEWSAGFAKSQKQKNVKALHNSYKRGRQGREVLEISSKSMQEGGEALSAFFLPKYVPELEKSVPVECVFQSGKVFQHGGPFKDLLNVTPREAKRDERLKTSGCLMCFTFDGREYPLIPKTIFYDFIYINALFENEELAKIALQYDAFTDIEFNPEKSLNCQAKACATFVSLSRMGLIDQVRDFDSFLALYRLEDERTEKKAYKPAPEKTEEKSINDVIVHEGDILRHPKYGEGVIEKVNGTCLTIHFDKDGKKELGLQWCLEKCELVNKN